MKETAFDVLGIGNALVDILSHAEDSFLAENGIEKGAMTLIEADRARELYGKIGPAVEASGGSAGNTMAGFAGLGGKGAYIAKVADDKLGEIFAHDIRAIGVHFDTPPLKGGDTGHCTIIVTPDAQRSMNTFLGASTTLCVDDVDEDLVASSQVTYMEGYLFDPPKAQEAFYKAAGIAHKAGRQVSLTLSDSFCVGRYRQEFQHLVENEVDILFANEAEITSLYETDSFDEAMEIVRGKCDIVALTRSEAGSVIVQGGTVHHIAADPIEKLVDTTGAGDQYAAGFLYGYTRGLGLKVAGEIASMAAAEVIQHMGPRPDADLKVMAKARGFI